MVIIFHYKPEVCPSVHFIVAWQKLQVAWLGETFLKKSHTNDDFDVAILSLK